MIHIFNQLRLLLGIERNTTSHSDKLVSALGAFLGIWVIYWGMRWSFPHGFLHTPGDLLMVTSMGATAVLLFAVPHGALSQPWAVIGGHLISAFVGVSCQSLFPDLTFTPALAVGLAVGAMYYLRAIHPPGGATALAAVIGGAEIHKLGFYYLLFPVLVNLVLIVGVAIIFNGCFHWRRYPAHIGRKLQPIAPTNSGFDITQEDFAAAMREMDSYVDINSETLTELLELARKHALAHAPHPKTIENGMFYSNGLMGTQWSIRQVIDASDSSSEDKDKIIYKVVAGAGGFETGICLRSEFQQWARYQVTQAADGHWLKIQN